MTQAFIHFILISVGFILFRAWRDGRTEPANDSALNKGEAFSPLTISVIIPARNEELNLAQLLPLLNQQKLPAMEIIVVDDNSSDQTAQVARQLGANVVTPGELPAGWRGKSWACWRGAQAAQGQLLVFLDADIMPQSQFLGWVASIWQRHRGFLTVQPHHHAPTFIEQGSAFFNVIVLAGSGQFIGPANWARSFGPCAICSREDYVRVGGHEQIKSAVLEHLQLGQHFRRHGYSNVAYAGRGKLQFRMYPEGLTGLIRGWSKSIALGAGSTSLPALIGICLWIGGLFGVASSVIQWMAGSGTIWSLLVYSVAMLQLWWIFRRTGTFSGWIVWVYPLYLTFFALIFASSTIRSFLIRKVSWKGREIKID